MARTPSSQAGELQVSAEVLSSLINSIEQFRKNVSTLQVEKTEMESTIEKPPRKSGRTPSTARERQSQDKQHGAAATGSAVETTRTCLYPVSDVSNGNAALNCNTILYTPVSLLFASSLKRKMQSAASLSPCAHVLFCEESTEKLETKPRKFRHAIVSATPQQGPGFS